MNAAEKPAEMSTTEARDDFARLVRDAEYGIATIITRHGKPIAKVAPLDEGDPA